MKLMLVKNQSQGMMGKVSFEVTASVELTDEEQNLIKHYKLDNEVLFQKKMINIWGQPVDHMIDVKVKNLVSGQVYKCKSLDEVITYKESLTDACKTLKSYLEIAKGFGGKEVIEIE